MATIIIKNIPKAYAEYLARHLPREHRKTKEINEKYRLQLHERKKQIVEKYHK